MILMVRKQLQRLPTLSDMVFYIKNRRGKEFTSQTVGVAMTAESLPRSYIDKSSNLWTPKP